MFSALNGFLKEKEVVIAKLPCVGFLFDALVSIFFMILYSGGGFFETV